MPRLRVTRRRVVLTTLGVLLLAVLSAAWIGYRGLAAQDHLEAARTQLETARGAASAREVDAARAAVDAAARETTQARALTGDPVWRVVGAVPWAGATVKTASALAEAADDLARKVLPAALAGVETADPAALRRPDGSVDLELLRSVTPAIVGGGQGVQQVERDLADLPRSGVVAPVAEARDELAEQVEELAGTMTAAARAVQLAPALLGADRSRRYVVLVQQNAESRGTGGVPAGFVVVEASDGRLEVVSAGTNADAPDGTVPPPDGVSREFRLRYGPLGVNDLWVNSTISPDLPATSRVVAQRFQVLRDQEIDGVVTVDAQGLAMILQGSEPLLLADGTQLPVDQLVEYLAVGQYAAFEAPVGRDVLARADERREALGTVGAQTASRLAGGAGDSEQLLRGLIDAVRSGHLQMASDDPALSLLAESGVDGALPSADRLVAYPVVFNSTGGKLDHFLDRSLRYESDGCDAGTRSSRVSVTLTNRAPESGLPPYVTVRQTPTGTVSSTENEVTLQVYVTAGSALVSATLDGTRLEPTNPAVPSLTRFLEGGLTAWSIRVTLPREQPRTLVLELEEPALPGQVQVPEQPLARPLQVEVDGPGC